LAVDVPRRSQIESERPGWDDPEKILAQRMAQDVDSWYGSEGEVRNNTMVVAVVVARVISTPMSSR
jgi:hypothetical protein